jgi:ElaB/YqjD/DUF883 family membrane-anchored ribosome-binding protein
MDNQHRSRGSTSPSGRSSPSHASEPPAQSIRAKAEEAVSKLTDVAQQAGSQAKQSATSTATDATKGAKRFLDDQIVAGADLAGHVADSVRSAADKLEPDAPQIAGLVRGAADGVERFSRDIRNQSIQDLWRTASDFSRKQPAVVFGLASFAGFLLFRVLKADSNGGGRNGQPYPPRGHRLGEDPRQAYGP